jgi:FkbH-like protein
MRLGEALQIVGKAATGRRSLVHLLCGFTPLHLETFVKAYLRLRFPEDALAVETGLYGDLEGNIQGARTSGGEGAIAVIEWGDLDPRLGYRSSAGWDAQTLEDIAPQIGEKCRRLEEHLAALARVMPVAVIAPTLALPPLTHLPPNQTSAFELRLNAILIGFLERVCQQKGIRLLNASTLATASDPAARHDFKMDLATGFPYSLQHADALAERCVSCLFPQAPKKGLITDLDNTLWKGILGDVGVEGVSWSLEDGAQAHALYQKTLASLAESGILVAVASKNDPGLVETALGRTDLLLTPERIFPVEAGWGAKSEAIGRILKTWNIGSDSVVFVDDSPMELAEVLEKYPGIGCLPFPTGDPAAILALVKQLRMRFGKESVREEDRLRLQSLRAATTLESEAAAEASPDFLSRLNAELTMESSEEDPRAFELVNKTNQFNLNGVRYSESEWKSRIQRPGAFLTTVSYKDRFGPLGRIAVLGGYREDERLLIDIWVMSCRAFSRHIEFQVLKQLFAQSQASMIRFVFKPTERNGPLQSFFGRFFSADRMAAPELDLSTDVFAESCPPLFHKVTNTWMTSEKN